MKNFSVVTQYLAATVVVGYAIFTWWMIREAGQSEVYWSRLVFLFEGIEAVVFGAAGLVFGTAIHRKQLEGAQKNEQEARKQAQDNQADAEIGRTLEAAVRANAQGAGQGDAPPARSGQIRGLDEGSAWTSDDGDNPPIQYLLRLVEQLRAAHPHNR